MSKWDPAREPVGEVLIGKSRNEWMVHLFVHEVHAIHWAAEDIQHRDIWRATVTIQEELEYVPPGQATFALKRRVGDDG